MSAQPPEDSARRLEPPPADVGVTPEGRETLPSGLESRDPIFAGEHPRPHLQAGVSPGNAESEDEDPDHPYGD